MILTDKIKKRKKKEIWCGGEAENVENFNSASLMHRGGRLYLY